MLVLRLLEAVVRCFSCGKLSVVLLVAVARPWVETLLRLLWLCFFLDTIVLRREPLEERDLEFCCCSVCYRKLLLLDFLERVERQDLTDTLRLNGVRLRTPLVSL